MHSLSRSLSLALSLSLSLSPSLSTHKSTTKQKIQSVVEGFVQSGSCYHAEIQQGREITKWKDHALNDLTFLGFTRDGVDTGAEKLELRLHTSAYVVC